MPTLAEHQQAYHNAMQAGDDAAAQVIMGAIYKAEKAEALKQTAADMDPVDRALANIGAGYNTAWEGVKQFVPGLTASPDADIKEKRTRDKALAAATNMHVAPDWMPTGGSALQFAGETAPTLAVPGVGVAGKVVQAGVSKVLPRASQAVLALSRAGGTGAAGGGLAGAVEPVIEDESRPANIAFGAAGGTVLPAAGAAWRGAKTALSNMTRAGGTQRAPGVLREALGSEADDIAAAAEARERSRRFQQPSVRDIPETLAEASGSPTAARVESQARRAPETAGAWDDFVGEQNATRFNAFVDATREGTPARLDARVASRDRVTGPLRERALGDAGQDPWFHVPAADAAERVAASPASANPAVQRVTDYVRSQIGADAKTAITPERLYEVRKVLADKLNGPHVIGDELSAATKGAQRETMALINGIDNALNDASGGRWQRYLDRYQDKSRPVNASRAARDARAVFEDVNIPTIGGAPEVTLNRLRAAQKAGNSNFDPRNTDFSPRAAQTLQEISEQAVRAQEPARVRKLVGTQGGGSQTSTDIEVALKSLSTGHAGWIGKIAEFFTRGSDVAMRTELSRLLQNPREAASAIRAAQQRGMPLSQAQQALLEAASRAAAGGTTAALTEQ